MTDGSAIPGSSILYNSADRASGLVLFRYYYDNAALSIVGISWDDFLAYYDQAEPAFVQSIGYSYRHSELSLDQFETVLRGIAQANQGGYPDYRDFIPAVEAAMQGLGHSLQLISQATVESVKQAGTALAVGAAGYAVVVGAIALVVLLGGVRR